MDDDELITAIAAGDDIALRELFSRPAPWLAIRLRSLLPATDTCPAAACPCSAT